MNLSDELKKMRNKGRYVVSIDYVLDSLREAQREDCENCGQIYKKEITKLRNDIQNVRGGDSNKPISEINRRSS